MAPDPIFGEYATIVAMASAGVAFVSMCATVVSTRTTRKAHRLALQQEARRAPAIELSLIDAWQTATADHDTFYVIQVLVANKSDFENSIKLTELKLTILDDQEMNAAFVTNFLLQPEPAPPDWIQIEDESFMGGQVSLQGRGVYAGHLVFRMPNKLKRSRSVGSLSLEMRDVLDSVIKLDSIIPRNVIASDVQ